MNNYYNTSNMMNYQRNMLPNNPISNQNTTFQTQEFYDPYQGFIRGDMFPTLYDTYKVDRPFEVTPINDQAKALTSIDALGFAMIDLNLYLDVNPNDQQAITLFNQYRIQKKQLVQNYESQYGPLTLDSDTLNTTPWIWDDCPWPWQN